MGPQPAVRAGQFWLCLGSHVSGPLGVSSRGGFKGRGPWGSLALLQANPSTESVLHPLRATLAGIVWAEASPPGWEGGTPLLALVAQSCGRRSRTRRVEGWARPPAALVQVALFQNSPSQRARAGTLATLVGPGPRVVPFWGQVEQGHRRAEGPAGEGIPSVSLALHA